MQYNNPVAYLITFVTYGTWLHGDDRGSVDRNHNVHGTPRLQPDAALERHRRHLLKHAPTVLNAAMRGAVDAAIREVCEHRKWILLEMNVRTNHVHVLVSSPKSADDVLRDFKAYATRKIRRAGCAPPSAEIWADGGSKRMLYNLQSVVRAARYVVEAQGPDLPMADIQRSDQNTPS